MAPIIFTVKLVAITISAIGLIHTLAWFSAPSNLGFNPHPWYLAAPQWLRELALSLSIPNSNFEVVIAYYLLLPVYLGACISLAILIWMQNRKPVK